MRGINFGSDEIRIILHVLSVTIWLGGQILMMALVPALRKVSPETTKVAAAAFGRVAWPAFAVAIATGIWNIMAVDLSDVSSGYNAVFGIKMLLVVATGLAAAMHQSTDKASMRALTGALGFVAALAAFILGVTMGH